MTYRIFEANYLISLVSSTLSQRTPPVPVRATEWRELYYLAEFHDITSISYYSLIGLEQVPEIWKNRFSKGFRKWVSIGESQAKEIPTVMDALEEDKIDFVILREWAMTRYYPQQDMRVVKDVEILIKPRDIKDIRYTMKDLGYHQEVLGAEGVLSFYKKPNYRIIFYTSLFEGNKKLNPYYKKVWKRLKSAVGFGVRSAFSVDDFYIYMIADVCDMYANGETDVRSIMDIYLYQKKHSEHMNRSYIESELSKLELFKMAECFESLAALWFGVYEGEETRHCKDVEEYIWSKGAYGRETSLKLLPMIQDAKIWRIREIRKKKIMRKVRWFFPLRRHMEGNYPFLRKHPIFLPLCWIFRWLSMMGFAVKIRFIRIKRFVSNKIRYRFGKKDNQDEINRDDNIKSPMR